jgi:3-phenylpropionate/trans-cinnamate dioxygenase ferredoxin subunit
MMTDYVKVAKVGDLREGQAKVFEANDERVTLCKVNGCVYAIADVCTHDGGPLGEGDLDGYEIICPRHGARFDVRTGAVLSFPAITPVDSFPVKLEGDDVLVQIGE